MCVAERGVKEELVLAGRMGMEEKCYRSPVRKLLRFFERSRNGWKEKCLTAKTRLKRLHNRVRQLEASRDRWKQRAQQMEERLRRMEQQEASKNAVAA